MKTSNSAAIGIFTVCGVLAFIVAVLLVSSGTMFSQDHKFVLYFDESVNGLDVGASVKLQGVHVGQVRQVLVHFDPTKERTQAQVTIAMENAYFHPGRRRRLHITPGESELEAVESALDFLRPPLIQRIVGTLQMESFVTGKLFINLNYEASRTDPYPSSVNGLPCIATRSSDLKNIGEQLIQIAESIGGINFRSIGQSLDQVIQEIQGLHVQKLGDAAFSFLDAVTALFTAIDPHSLLDGMGNLSTRLEMFFQDLQNALPDVLVEVSRACREFSSAAVKLQALIEPRATLPKKTQIFLEEIGSAARSVRDFFDFLEQNPNALLTGKQAVEMQ
jgi:paraquat-inducible protein B